MQSRRGRVLLVAAFVLACSMVVPFAGIGASWRECDTQAMSISLATESFDVLRPRVDWRGDTDGGVESEMPLYQAAVASVLLWAGEVDWAGRVLSLLATVVSALALQGVLGRATGSQAAALAGCAAFLASGAAVLTACRVMPDATSLAACLVGWELMDRWLRGGRAWHLLLATLCTTAGCLAKPTSLQVVMLEAGWMLVLAPRLLFRPAAWLHLAVPCIATLAWMWHAHGIHLETGLTFGVLAEGDSKLPHLSHLLAPGLHLALARNALWFGPGVAGYLAFAALVVLRRTRWLDAAVLLPMGFALVATLRYSALAESGPHYHLWAAVGGAWCVARAWSEVPGRMPRILLMAMLLATALVSLLRERAFRLDAASSPVLQLAAVLRESTGPADLVAIRSAKAAHDAFWDRPNNHEDPIVLHHARRKGWVLPRDAWVPGRLAALRDRGVRAVVDQAPWSPVASVNAWLAAHATEVSTSPAGSVHLLGR